MFKKIEGAEETLRTLDVYEILEFFSEEKSIRLEDHVLGFELKKFIMDVNFDKINQLSREFFKDKPKEMPDFKRPEIKLEDELVSKINDEKIRHERLMKLLNEPTAIREEYKRRVDAQTNNNDNVVLEEV